MNRRFPQKVRVGDLIDLPLQDYNDRIVGHVTQVTRNLDGAVGLVVSQCAWWIWDCRLVRVPIETVVILARHLNLMDIKRDEYLQLATWNETQDTRIAADETILIGIGRR